MNRTIAEKIFAVAIKLPTPQERAAYVRGACGEDQALRLQVESLIQAHEEVGGFMPTDPGEAAITLPDRPLSESEGTCIGRYKLLQRIGEGGMGVIYMAEQTEPVTRKVALKIIKLGMDTKRVIARFEAERQALAMMDHPNIAKVLDAGATDTGRPYFVMELVKGVPINQYCDKNHLPTKERLQLFIAVCQAIHHAHQKGVIHRDVKPSNILVTLHDGRPVPKVIDFGIAKATNQKLTEKTLFTHFAQMIGTPAYMSPEQAEMSGLDVDTRTDVYSLGVLLYELLTGTTPFPEKELLSKGYGEMQRIIAEQEPERPSLRVSTLVGEQQTIVSKNRSTERLALQRQIKGDLDWIVMKALEKDRTHRYDTPNNLAADIERHLSDEPVLAAQPTVLYQLGKLYRRHKVAMATAACFVLLLTVSACVSTAQAIKNRSLFTAAEEARLNEMSAKERETELRRIAETERGKAEVERDRSQRLLYIANMNLAKRAWDEANVGRAVELLELHRPQPGQPDLRNFEWFYLDRLCHSELLTINTEGYGLTFGPDGKRLAATSVHGVVKIWDAASGNELVTLKGKSGGSFAFSSDGKRLVSTHPAVKVWDAASGAEVLTLKGHTNLVVSVALSADGARLASASYDRTVRVWDTTSGQEMLVLRLTNFPQMVAFIADGKRLVAATSREQARGAAWGEMIAWDAMSGEQSLALNIGEGLGIVGWSADGKRLAAEVWARTGTLKILDGTSGHELIALRGHSDAITRVEFNADGTRLASVSWDRTAKIWNTTTGEEIFTFKLDCEAEGFAGSRIRMAFSPDGNRLATAIGEGPIKVWDATRSQESLAYKDRGYKFALSADGKWYASGNRDRNHGVKMLDTLSGQESLTLKRLTNRVAVRGFSPDGLQLASLSADRTTLNVWDTATGREMLTLSGHTGYVFGVAFSPDRKRLASAQDRRVKVWDAINGREMLTLSGHTNYVSGVAFSPNGKRLASASWDKTVKVWDVTSGQELLTLKGHNAAVANVAFSPDGERLASASADWTVKIWAAASGQQVFALKGHSGNVYDVAFSHDGERLASASDDRTLKVWDVTSGQETLTLNHKTPVYAVAFSSDGKRLVSVGVDSVVVWDAQPRTEARSPEAKAR